MSVPRNRIVLSVDPRGRYHEGVLASAAKPGTCVAVTDVTKHGGASNDVLTEGGESYEHEYTPGFAGIVTILTHFKSQLGGTPIDSDIPANDRCNTYSPLPGEEFMALGLSGATLNAGSRATFNAAGKLIASATGPIIVMEDGGTLAADTLLYCRLGGLSTATAS